MAVNRASTFQQPDPRNNTCFYSIVENLSENHENKHRKMPGVRDQRPVYTGIAPESIQKQM